MSRRDLGGELLTMLGVIGTLALALTFGLLLVISGSRTPPQGTPVVGVTLSASEPVASRETAISADFTLTASPTVEITATTAPSASPTAAVTARSTQTTQPSITPSRTPGTPSTALIMSSGSPTKITAVSATPTTPITQTPRMSASVTASATPFQRVTIITMTPEPSRTPSRTASATRAATVTRTPVPSATFTSSPTRTHTRVASATFTPTFTRTPSPTVTASRTPTRTLTFTPTVTPTETISIVFVTPLPTTAAPVIIASLSPATLTPVPACVPPAGWQPYVVQFGDNLITLSARSGVSGVTFLNANCLPLTGSIRVGLRVYVPPAFFAPTPIPPPTQTQGDVILSGVNVKGCEAQGAQLFTPKPGATVRGELTVLGAAEIANFAFYKLELAPENGSQLWNVGTVNFTVRSGVLGKVNLTIFAPGVYWLTLTVVDQTSSYLPPCSVRFVIGS